MLQSLWNLLLGCTHQRTTFPMTPARRAEIIPVKSIDDMRRNMYVVCLDCGKELDYDWNEMRIVRNQTKPVIKKAKEQDNAV